MSDQPLFLVDGSGFLFRAYHALPPLNNPQGTPVGAVYGFCTMLIKLLETHDPKNIVVVFDAHRRNFRHDLYAQYKANRLEPPEDLIPQFALVRQATQAFHIQSVECEGYEADDLIATYAHQAHLQGQEVVIVSSDKDLMQLMTHGVRFFDPMKNAFQDEKDVEKKFGVAPTKVADVQALAGDSSDHVPGVPGIGLKTAAQLILEHGDLEGVLSAAPAMKQPKRRENLTTFADQARLSLKLVTLCRTSPMPLEIETFYRESFDPEKLGLFLKEHGFRSLLSRMVKKGHAALPLDTAPEAQNIFKKPSIQYTLIQDPKALETFVAKAQGTGFLALDTETTSLDAHTARLVGISLCHTPGQAAYIPLGHGQDLSAPFGTISFSSSEHPAQMSLEDAKTYLRPLFQDPSLIKVAHNAKYDLMVLMNHGFDLESIHDTMVMSYALEGSRRRHNLDSLSLDFLNHQTISFQEVVGQGSSQKTFDQIAPEDALTYACEDADICLQLFHLLRARLWQESCMGLYEGLDRPCVKVLAAMEKAGIWIDADHLRKTSLAFEKRLDALEQDIMALAPRPFNVGSPLQLSQILFEDMGLEKGKKGKSGVYSTSADVLEKLAYEGHTIAEKILAWRQLSKLKNTYTEPLVAQINPHTHRLHTSFAQTMTTTGRLSSSQPNVQNIPIRTLEGQEIRKAFQAPPGNVLLSADYSQIELRLLAHMGHIDPLITAFHQGQDIHAQTASDIFHVPLEEVTSTLRRSAKTINFGIIYGISAYGLAKQLLVPQKEAKAMIQRYFEKYPGIKTYMDKTIQEARENGYVTTLMGRKCPITGIHDRQPALRANAERQAINAPLQGSAADIIKGAMIQVYEALKDSHPKALLLLQVHDELVIQVPEKEVQDVAMKVKKYMEGVISLKVPLLVDVHWAKSWQEAHG